MAAFTFEKAARRKVAPKLAIQGVSGAGKTYSALRFARGYVGENGRIAFIDTENGSASLYADLTPFDVLNVAPRSFGEGKQAVTAFWWTDFRDAINAAIVAGYDFLIIDSASHIWQAALDLKTRIDLNGGNSFVNWGQAGQTFNTVQNLILQAAIPVLCCFRSKMEYSLEENDKGKKEPRKVGLAPITRNDAEYDFTTVFDVARSHIATIAKTRAPVFDDTFEEQITEKTGAIFRAWIDS